MTLDLDPVWRSLDDRVASGWAPGIVAGVRHGGTTHFHTTGSYDLQDTAPMTADTPFRIASLTKIAAGVLAGSLIAEGRLRLDDEIAEWMPELASPRVLRSPTADLDDTVPTDRGITVRDLLTFTTGLGVQFEDAPLSRELRTFGFGPLSPPWPADQYLARIASLPLAHQPGSHWMYHTSADLLGVLLARVTGKALHELLRDVITAPLGLTRTGFFATEPLPTQYRPEGDGIGVATEYDGAFSSQPAFESLGGGLVSTVPEYLRFLSALADGELLPADVLAQMTTAQLDARQQAGPTQLAGPGVGWGWCVSVEDGSSRPWSAPGRWGWTGGSGTSAYVDPSRGLIGVVMSQRFMAGPQEDFGYFWAPLAASIDDA
ncbi:serine hydrolase domain-containing protein [Humibacter soli]